jgi:hypothetical protein
MSVWNVATNGTLGIEHLTTGMKRLGLDTPPQTSMLVLNVIKSTHLKGAIYNET